MQNKTQWRKCVCLLLTDLSSKDGTLLTRLKTYLFTKTFRIFLIIFWTGLHLNLCLVDLAVVFVTSLTYLDLVSPVPCGTLVDDSSPVGTIAGSSHLVAPVYAHHLQISFSVSYHVLWGFPMLVLPSSGLHSMARLASLVGGSRRMCPMYRILLVATMSCNAVYLERVITSLFVMWLRNPQDPFKAATAKDINHLGSFCCCFHVSQTCHMLLLLCHFKNFWLINLIY